MNAPLWIAGVTALLMSIIMLPIARAFSMRFHLYDAPGPLKIHTEPIPRLGGVALVAALVAGILLSSISDFRSSVIFFLALGMIWVTSLTDDLRDLSPQVRLASQVVAALILWQGGWRLSVTGTTAVDLVATCLFVSVFANAFNMLDGADGLAGGVAGIIGFGYVLLLGGTTSSLGIAVAWSLVGSCMGFLLFNFPPAKIFMGDSGSTALGFAIAFLGLDLYRGGHAPYPRLLVPLIYAGLPLLDFIFTCLRRLRKGSSPFTGDRGHFYDLLLQRGWSARRVAFFSYMATGLLVVVGWLCHRGDWAFSLYFLPIIGYLLIAAVQPGSLRHNPVSPEIEENPHGFSSRP